MKYILLDTHGDRQGYCYTCKEATGTARHNFYTRSTNCLDCYIKHGRSPRRHGGDYTWRQCNICKTWGLAGVPPGVHKNYKCICNDCKEKYVNKYIKTIDGTDYLYKINYSVISKCPNCDTGIRITKRAACGSAYYDKHHCETCEKREEIRCFGCGVAMRVRNFTDDYKDDNLDHAYSSRSDKKIHWCTSRIYREDIDIDDEYYDPTGDPYCQALRKHLEYNKVDHDLDLSSLHKQVFDIKYQLEKRKNERKKQNNQRTKKHPMGLHGRSDCKKDDCKGCKCDNRSSQQHHQGCEAGT